MPQMSVNPEDEWIVESLVAGLIARWSDLTIAAREGIIESAAAISGNADTHRSQAIIHFIERHRRKIDTASHAGDGGYLVEAIPYGRAILNLWQIGALWRVDIEPGHTKTQLHADRYNAMGDAEIMADSQGLGPSA